MIILFLALFGLRLFGQGLMSHLAIIGMARWFSKKRGQALSLILLGHPVGEALLPILATFFLTFLTWHEIWVVLSLSIVIIFLPLLYLFGKCIQFEEFNKLQNDLIDKKDIPFVSWNRKQVLKDLRFYQIMPGLLASPFIITGVLFHQVHLVEIKSWSLTTFASCYPLYALSATGVTLLAGWMVDRLSAVHLLRFYLFSSLK